MEKHNKFDLTVRLKVCLLIGERMNNDKVQEIVERWDKRSDLTIEMLHDVQSEFNYLPKEALSQISAEVGVPLSNLLRIATFFNIFSLKPRGRHFIRVCLGTACHVRGGTKILEKLESDLNIRSGETTEDFNFSLLAVNCLGCCGLAPMLTVDKDIYGKVTLSKIPGILKKYTGDAKKIRKENRTDDRDAA